LAWIRRKIQPASDEATAEIEQDAEALESLTDEINNVDYKLLIEMIKETQRSTVDNLNRIRSRTRIYDANFRKLKTHLELKTALDTVYEETEAAEIDKTIGFKN